MIFLKRKKYKKRLKNLGFVHIPRTGGSYLDSCLFPFLKKENYFIYNSWREKKERDWTKQELLSFLETSHFPSYVHNHSKEWPKDVFYKYKKRDWFMFSFVRHPGDKYCSEYYYFYQKNKCGRKDKLTLDEFIKNSILNPRPGSIIPEYWPDFNYVAEFNHQNILMFFKNILDCKYEQKKIVLKSANKGYGYYCRQNEISKKTQQLLEESKEFKIFEKIKMREKFIF